MREAEPSYGYRSQVYDYNNYGYNLGHNNYGYNYGYQQHSIHKGSPVKKGFPIKFLPIIGKREAEPGYGYRSQVYDYNNYGYILGHNNYGYNYGYKQHSIHKRSPFKKGFPIKFLPIIGKREAETVYGYRSQVYDHNNYGCNQQHSIHKRSPFKKGFPIKFLPIIG